MAARKEYLQCLNGLEEAKMMMSENDPEMKEMAREEAAANKIIVGTGRSAR